MPETLELHSLVYFSHAVSPLGPDALQDLLDVSRQANQEHGITGILIYGCGNFAQYLEGPKVEIDTLFVNIQRDSRHRDVQLLAEGPITTRIFADWSMTFRPLGQDVIEKLPGAVDPVDALRTVLDIPATSAMTVLLKSLIQAFLPGGPASPRGA